MPGNDLMEMRQIHQPLPLFLTKIDDDFIKKVQSPIKKLLTIPFVINTILTFNLKSRTIITHLNFDPHPFSHPEKNILNTQIKTTTHNIGTKHAKLLSRSLSIYVQTAKKTQTTDNMYTHSIQCKCTK